MNIDIKKIIAEIRSIGESRIVELLVCAAAYLFSELEGSYINTMLLMPIVFGAVYAVNNVTAGSNWHRAYYATAALIVVALAVDAARFVDSMAYGFSLLLTAMAILLSHSGRSDRSEGEHFANMTISAAMALVMLGTLCVLAVAIIYSVVYVFGLDCTAEAAVADVARFAACIVAPLTFMISMNAKVANKVIHLRFFDIMFNYVLGGAIIVYTAILYAYMLKIVATWQLPLGGLAAMITAFYIVAFVGMLINRVIPNRFCDWYYTRFGYISLPLLVLFWTGLAYRIMQYSFTESRVYMALAGVVMVVGSVVLIAVRGKRFAIILGCAALLIATFSYIPVISARHIGLSCQRSRITAIATELGIYDSKSHKIKYIETVPDEQADKYQQLVSCYRYLRNETSREAVEAQYGKINESIETKNNGFNHELDADVDLNGYTRLVTNFYESVSGNNVVVTIDNDTIINQPLRHHVDKNGKVYLTNDDHIYTTDKYMLVIKSIYYDTETGKSKIYYDNYLFAK